MIVGAAVTLRDVEIALRPFAERVATTDRAGWTTDRTMQLARTVGGPHERLRVVHVAGTSGKTTTSYYIAGLLSQAGKKVGLTVSPHIASVNERVQIAGVSLDEARFVLYFNEFHELITHSELEPTYFEFMMVFALWVFEKEQVEYAVVETGFGGRYDSSDICRRSDKVCVITDIGFDHMHILGNTLRDIASQKAGIIAPNNIVCMYEQSDEIMDEIHKEADAQDATVRAISNTPTKTYSERNFALAEAAYEFIVLRDGLTEPTGGQKDHVLSIQVPGRLEKIKVGNTTFILDGAHNEQKMRALLNTLDTLYPDKKWPVLLSIKADKRSKEMSQLLTQYASEIVTTEFTHGQDMPSHATSADELMTLFDDTELDIRAISNLEDALHHFLQSDYKEVLVTGSFYMVAEARAWLLKEKQGTIIV